MKHFSKTTIAAAIFAGMLVLSAPAHATFDAPMVIAAIINWGTSFISSQFANFLNNLYANAAVVGSNVQLEMNKAAITQLNTSEAIASYKAQERLRQRAQDQSDALQQPNTMCQTISASNSLNTAETNTRVSAFRATVANISAPPRSRSNTDGSKSATLQEALAYTSNSQRAVVGRIDYTMKTFCTEEDAKRGRCTYVPENSELAGADFNAAYLFHGSDSSNTYTKGQDVAVDLYIERITEGVPVEMLRDPKWEQSDKGKAYIEMVRRYAAFKSMTNFSLNQIKAAHMPQQPTN